MRQGGKESTLQERLQAVGIISRVTIHEVRDTEHKREEVKEVCRVSNEEGVHFDFSTIEMTKRREEL